MRYRAESILTRDWDFCREDCGELCLLRMYFARALGLKPKGTIFVLAAAMRKKLLTYAEYLDSREGLVKAGFRMSEEIYLEAVRIGRSGDKTRYKER